MIRTARTAVLLMGASTLLLAGCELIRNIRQSMTQESASSMMLNGAFARLATTAWEDLYQVRRSGSLPRDADGGSMPGGQAEGDGGSAPDAGVAPSDNPWREIRECFQRMESYGFAIEVLADRYRVRVTPVQERCVAGNVQLYGGAATYVISRDFEILERSYEE